MSRSLRAIDLEGKSFNKLYFSFALNVISFVKRCDNKNNFNFLSSMWPSQRVIGNVL